MVPFIYIKYIHAWYITNSSKMEFQPCCTAEIFDAPRFRMFIEKFGGHAVNTWLGAFGAPTWKLVKLFGSDPFLYKLFRTTGLSNACFFQNIDAPTLFYIYIYICYICWPWRKLDKSKFKKSESTICYKDGAGRKRFKGSPTLKDTQVYTRSFGTAEPRLHFMFFFTACIYLFSDSGLN